MGGEEDAVGSTGSAAHGVPGGRIQNLIRVKLMCSQGCGKQHVDGCTKR